MRRMVELFTMACKRILLLGGGDADVVAGYIGAYLEAITVLEALKRGLA